MKKNNYKKELPSRLQKLGLLCTMLFGLSAFNNVTASESSLPADPSGPPPAVSAVGFWTPLTNAAPSTSGGVSLVLSDGTVMCKSSAGGGGIGNVWNKLTPNASGSYANGTWSTIAPMLSTRLYFSSQILKDGRVYVAGGEYGTGLQQAETYNPLTNIWTAAPSPGLNISDANSEILEDGRILQALVTSPYNVTKIYNPATNTYSAGPSSLGVHNESAWVKLPDNSILMVDIVSTNSERYIPSLNTWVSDANVPVSLFDPFGSETGGALLLPDGRAFFIGSLGHNAYYTPSGNNTPGAWAAAPDIPGGLGVPDGAAAMMVNGKILLACSPIPTSGNHFPSPTSFFEFDYLTNTFTAINTPSGSATANMSSYLTNMTALPDGTILYSELGSSQYSIYTPGSAALAAGKPSISKIIANTCSNFKITGTQFNGISQGATYGDDWQMASNYPIVRLTNGANVYYARTANWNSTGVMRGNKPDTAEFTLPVGLPVASYSLVVIANGIASNPVTFNSSLTPTITGNLTPCIGSTTTLGTSLNYTSYLWSTGATTPSIVVSANATYTVTVSSGPGCTGTATAKVVKKARPVISVTPADTNLCPPVTSVALNASGNAATYNWSPATGLNVTTGTLVTASPAATTNYTVTGTSANGCTSTVAAKVNVKPKPVNLTTTNIVATSAKTNWTLVDCAVGYVVQYRVAAGVWISTTINTNTPTKTLTGLTASTNYNWRVKTKFANGTFSTYTAIVNFTTPALRIGETATNNALQVYPNPATDKLTLEFPFTDGDAIIDVVNSLGQSVLNKKVSNAEGTIEINIQSLTEGIYFVKVTNAETILNSRFIKK